jgi:hypothetical protein
VVGQEEAGETGGKGVKEIMKTVCQMKELIPEFISWHFEFKCLNEIST